MSETSHTTQQSSRSSEAAQIARSRRGGMTTEELLVYAAEPSSPRELAKRAIRNARSVEACLNTSAVGKSETPSHSVQLSVACEMQSLGTAVAVTGTVAVTVVPRGEPVNATNETSHTTQEPSRSSESARFARASQGGMTTDELLTFAAEPLSPREVAKRAARDAKFRQGLS
mmetsp:Transcript_114690/g.370814  ORF Transcript_114690/g.370814 Transcript_114690/m.370814 type:complete len:172 (+) Transcript_114690:192-707(+)